MTKRFIFALLLSCSPLWATTYYVDNCVNVGNDRNNGTSTTTPWLTINKVNTSTFNPGDSILFESTCTWREQLTVPSSGAAGSPITFGAYGTGAAPIISGANLFTSWTPSSGSLYYASYSTAPNQVFEDGARLTQNTVSAASLTAGQWYLDTVNSRIWVYLTAGDSPSGHTMEASQRLDAVNINGENYVTVQGLELEETTSACAIITGGSTNFLIADNIVTLGPFPYAFTFGIEAVGASQGRITGNTVTNSYSGIAASGYESENTSSVQIDHNSISYMANSGIVIGVGASNITVEYNYVSYTGQTVTGFAGIYSYNSGTGNVIRYNLSASSGAGDSQGTGYELDVGSAPTQLYGNVGYSSNGACISTMTSGHSIYNNTCYNNSTGSFDLGELNFYSGASSDTVENNIFVASTGKHVLVAYPGSTTGHTLNYNLFYSSLATPFDWGGTSYKLANYRSASSQDANSLNSAPTFYKASVGQFWLTGGSPGIDAGLNLGSPYNIGLMPGGTWPNSVVTGDQNAYGSGWEIGAFVYVPAVAPPSNLQAVVH